MDFNKKKCLELMKESSQLEKKGKFLGSYDQTKYNELLDYHILLGDNIFWNSREKYLQIIESFLHRSIDVNEFIKQFDKLRRSNLDEFKLLEKNLIAEAYAVLPEASEIDLKLNPQSVKFSHLIETISNCIELLNPNHTLEIDLEHPELIVYGMSEEFFRITLKDNYLPRILKYSKKS